MKISNGGDLATRISENKPASVSTSPMVKPHARIPPQETGPSTLRQSQGRGGIPQQLVKPWLQIPSIKCWPLDSGTQCVGEGLMYRIMLWMRAIVWCISHRRRPELCTCNRSKVVEPISILPLKDHTTLTTPSDSGTIGDHV